MADAARELTEAVRLDPRNPDALAQLAFAELALGLTDLARTHTAAALAIDPSHALARQLDAVLRRMDS
jgi:Tfp pilus assembly protein PilF